MKDCSVDRLSNIIRTKLKLGPEDEVGITLENFRLYLNNTLTIKLAEMVNILIYRGNSCITPTGFKKIIDRKVPSLGSFFQSVTPWYNNILLIVV